MHLLYCGITAAEAARAYGAWLTGTRPENAAVILTGPAIFLVPEGLAPTGTRMEEGVYSVLADPLRAETAFRNLRAWRRLPPGTAAALTAAGIQLFPADAFTPPAEAAPLTFPDILNDVLTEKEGAELAGIQAKALRARCEAGQFGALAKPTPSGWLMARAALTGESPAINPLLLVYATTEAARLWGRSAEDLRSAAAGAGHRAARLGEGERRRAGRTWLVTRAAMEKLCGDPIPEEWKQFVMDNALRTPEK